MKVGFLERRMRRWIVFGVGDRMKCEKWGLKFDFFLIKGVRLVWAVESGLGFTIKKREGFQKFGRAKITVVIRVQIARNFCRVF